MMEKLSTIVEDKNYDIALAFRNKEGIIRMEVRGFSDIELLGMFNLNVKILSDKMASTSATGSRPLIKK